MPKKPCQHGSLLPRGIKCDRGYLAIRLKTPEGPYFKGCGLHTKDLEKIALIALNDIRKAQYEGRFSIAKKAERLKFKEVRQIFYTHHFLEYREPTTNLPRTDKSIRNALSFLDNLGSYFDSYFWDAIEANHFKKYRDLRLQVVGPAAFNKEWGMMRGIYREIPKLIDLKEIAPLVLPKKDPTRSVSKLQENKRERMPDTWEMVEAYKWCTENNADLWYGIEQSLVTALRKADLLDLEGNLTVKGIQQKTGEEFDLPITLDKPVKYSQKAWNTLRRFMNWMKEPIQGHTRAHKHTTWHDLRHWAPSFLGEKGTPIKLIQAYGGWSREETAERYTNIREQAMAPLVATVKSGIDEIKRLAKESGPEGT